MTKRSLGILTACSLLAGAWAFAAWAQDAIEAPPDFSGTYLTEADNIAAGRVVWEEQCRHCHGKAAYPGKAPKLKPRRYKPDFVFKRVTNGFRKMPAWKEVYTREERMAVVAYILSDQFSP